MPTEPIPEQLPSISQTSAISNGRRSARADGHTLAPAQTLHAIHREGLVRNDEARGGSFPSSNTTKSAAANQVVKLAVMHRLRIACSGLSVASIARSTNANSETVRRAIRGQGVGLSLLAQIAVQYGISIHWLLTGEGPPRTDQLMAWALAHADFQQLSAALGDHLARLPPKDQLVTPKVAPSKEGQPRDQPLDARDRVA